MANQCPTGFNITYLRDQLRLTYERVAREPHGHFHFHHGLDYAVRYLGYARAELEQLPEIATDRFSGVGNPLAMTKEPDIGPLSSGQVVLDHACGAGMDLLLAARHIAPNGRAIGVDMTPGMHDCATEAAAQSSLAEMVNIRKGVYENLPIKDDSVDVVISNGVVNLAPDKTRVFKEIFRVLKAGGRLLLADVVVQRELALDARSNPDLWVASVGGALIESELTEIAERTGFIEGRVIHRFNSFKGTSAEAHVSEDLCIQGVNFFARKPL